MPGADLEAARAEPAPSTARCQEYPEAYPQKSNFQIAKLLRDQITSRAQTVLLLLLAASALIFVIACSNVANLILARSVRREGELAIRAALALRQAAPNAARGKPAALRQRRNSRVIVALWMAPILGRYASRFSVRALDLTVDASVLWVGVGLALTAAVLLAFAPRLAVAGSAGGLGLSNGTVRITSGTNRRLRLFAVMQIAASFVLLAGAGALLTTLIALQRTRTGIETRQVLVVNVPVMSYGRTPEQRVAFYQEIMRQIEQLPGVDRVSVGSSTPWRDARGQSFAPHSVEGYARGDGEEDPRARCAPCRRDSSHRWARRSLPAAISTENDRRGGERVVIVSQSVAQRMFPSVDAAVNSRLMWTDRVILQFGASAAPRRVVGVAADIDDENIVPGPAMTVYHPLSQSSGAGGCSCTREQEIRTRWSLRSRASFARCRRSSRLKGRQPWRTYAPRCWRPID